MYDTQGLTAARSWKTKKDNSILWLCIPFMKGVWVKGAALMWLLCLLIFGSILILAYTFTCIIIDFLIMEPSTSCS